MSWTIGRAEVKFLSTPSARRATQRVFLLCQQLCISIHALREEGDTTILTALRHLEKFLSTPSARRATKFKYPKQPDLEISIHALREEGDLSGSAWSSLSFDFYPRPPRGGRQAERQHPAMGGGFLSTPSARRATQGQRSSHCGHQISIHALREEGDMFLDEFDHIIKISIHALREEGDNAAFRLPYHHPISIHALREEGDGPSRSFLPGCRYFYPRPPRGGRLRLCSVTGASLWISIHALREEGDWTCPWWTSTRPQFLSTPSARRATPFRVGPVAVIYISIHALREEGDRKR